MSPPTAMRDRTEEILDRHLDKDFFCATTGKGAASAKQLRAVAKKYGCKLPRDFVAHSTGKFGGIYVEVKAEVWPRAKEFDVGPFWSFLYGVFVYGLSPDVPEWMNMDLAAAEFRDSTGHTCVPCLKVVGNADSYLFDSNGDIESWDHETNELVAYDGSFFDLLDHEIGELRQRKELKVEEKR